MILAARIWRFLSATPMNWGSKRSLVVGQTLLSVLCACNRARNKVDRRVPVLSNPGTQSDDLGFPSSRERNSHEMQAHCFDSNPGTAHRIQLGRLILVSAAIRIRNSSGEYGSFR